MIRLLQKITFICVAFFFYALAVASPVFALTVQPLVIDMASSGPASRSLIKVDNPGNREVFMEVAIKELELGPNGEKKTRSAGDEFLVFPPQARISPGASQVFRIQWVGEPDIKKSKTYSFSIGQVPVKMPEGTTGIQVVLSFAVTLSVSPPKALSSIQVIKAEPAANKNGKRFVALTLKNPGNKHAYLRDSTVVVSGGSWSAKMDSSEIGQKVGLGLVQPGKKRRIFLPIEVPAKVSAITAKVDYKPKK